MQKYFFCIIFIMLISTITYADALSDSSRDVYYCYYATTFDLMQMDANGKDEVFENLKTKFQVLGRFDKNNITYSPKRLATKKGIEKTIRYLLGMDMDRNKRNHLIFILNGFAATDSSFYTVSINSSKDEFSYVHLLDTISKYLPVSSIFFIFNFYVTETTDLHGDAILALLKKQVSIPYAALICKQYASQTPESVDGLQLFIDSFEGGADENLDQILTTDELKKYFDLKESQFKESINTETLFAASDDSAFNIALTPVQADTFSLRTYNNRSYTFSPKLYPVPHIIVFGTTWCLPCQVEKKVLKILLKSYPSNKIIYISEDTSDKYAEAKKQSVGYPFVFLLDIGQEIYSKYADHIGYPLTMIIDRSGIIRFKKQGFDDADRQIMQNIIQKLNQN